MICPACGANTKDGLKFCTECGARLQPKPDFEPQTAYRRETFERGPDPIPDPSKPLPLSTAPHGAKANAQNNQARKQEKEGKSSRTGCIIGIVVAAIAILLLAASCSALSRCSAERPISSYVPASGSATASPANAAVDSKDTWTVLFYLCGSDLESESGLATFNLQELASTKLGDKVTFAVETGGSRSWRNSTVDPRFLTRYVVSSGGFYEEQKLPSASMAVSSTFEDFVSWGVKNYPADHYMLVLWDHGGGSVYGVCNDELFPYSSGFESDTLTLTEISEGLQDVGVKFDVIGFDTCLMATYETAAILAPYSDYLVASEEVEPGSGWDYTSWPQWLGAHTGATGAQIGAEICDTFYAKCKLYNAHDMATLSVVDLSKIDALSDSFYEASREIAMATSDRKALRALYYASLEATCFGGDRAYNMVDLGDLMRKASSVIAEHYDDVIDDVNNAVVYQVHGRSHPSVTGLSVFYPLDTSYKSEFYGFLDVAANIPYAQFTAVMFGLYNTVDWNAYSSSTVPVKAPVVEEDVSFDYDERVNDEGQLQIHVTQGLADLAQASIELSLFLPENDAVVYLGVSHDVTADWDEGVFTDDFYGTWMAINGNWVSTVLLEAGDGYRLYAIPVLLNGENANLIARYDFGTQQYEIVCACAEIDESKMAPKKMRSLEEGDVVAFRFSGYLIRDEQEISFEMGEVTWGDDVIMEDVDLGEGTFLLRFALIDVLGEEHVTDLYAQDYRNGTITVETLVDYLQEIGYTL